MSMLSEIKSYCPPRFAQTDFHTVLESNNVNDAFKDYKTAISENVKINIEILKEVPVRKDLKKELMKRFEAMITKDFETDELFEKRVEIHRYAKDMSNSIESYFRETYKFNKERKKQLSYQMFTTSKMFLNSDLPISYVKTLNNSLLTEMDFIDLFEKEVRKEKLRLLVSRQNEIKFQRICEEHNVWANKFAEMRNTMDRIRVKLDWYIDFNNSKDVDEIFKEKIIKSSSLDRNVLFGFINELLESVRTMEKQNITKMGFDFSHSSDNDDGTMTMVKMMKLLSH